MSTDKARPPAGGGMFGGGGPGAMGMRLPAEKPQDFRGSLRRMRNRLHPERVIIAVVLALATISVVFAGIGPKLLGDATNILFAGVIGRQLPAGMTQQQAEEITHRLDSLARLFHPHSQPFADVMGISRALLGLDPKL